MKSNKLSILLAISALVISTLACALGGEPGVSNVRMTTDETGETPTTVYSPSDDFYVYFDVNGMDTGTSFEGRWYALNIEGEDPTVPFQTIQYNLEEDVTVVYFQLFSDTEWPIGTYKVEIYMNGVLSGTAEFSVQ
jgi:hypothetical protein